MNWSIFDPKNKATLGAVKDLYQVPDERLKELESGLERARGLMKQRKATLSAGALHIDSRSTLISTLNVPINKKRLARVMKPGVLIAYALDQQKEDKPLKVPMAKRGRKSEEKPRKVFVVKMGRRGDVTLVEAKVENPASVTSEGLFRVAKQSSEKPRGSSHHGGYKLAVSNSSKPRVIIEEPIEGLNLQSAA